MIVLTNPRVEENTLQSRTPNQGQPGLLLDLIRKRLRDRACVFDTAPRKMPARRIGMAHQ